MGNDFGINVFSDFRPSSLIVIAFCNFMLLLKLLFFFYLQSFFVLVSADRMLWKPIGPFSVFGPDDERNEFFHGFEVVETR